MIKMKKPNRIQCNGQNLNDYYFDQIKKLLVNFDSMQDMDKLFIIKEYLTNKKISFNDFFESIIKDDVFAINYKFSDLLTEYIDLCDFKKKEKNDKFLLIQVFVNKYKCFNKSDFLTKKGEINKKSSIRKMQSYVDEMNDKLHELLNYDILNSELKHEIIASLNVSVCPYCNRIYISNYIDEDEIKPTSDLDHNYPKSIFPLFSLSIFNFIPTCLLCNRSFKHFNYFFENPYYDSFDAGGFYFKIKHVDDTNQLIKMKNGLINASFEIVSDGDTSVCNMIDGETIGDKVEKEIEFFKLEKLYDSHSNYAKEVLYKKFKRYESYLSKINPNGSTILYGYDFSNDNEALNKPLFKFTKDLLFKN